MESPSNGDLPPDVIHEILLRLPVKTLLRFKCVCKQWYTLIGSWDFVNQHLGHESNQERLLVRLKGPKREGFTFALYVDEMCSDYEEPDHLQMPNAVRALQGPLNGVFCVVNKWGHMALLNPAMRQFKPLPTLQCNDQPHLLLRYSLCGFGVDPLSGDYKLVLLQYFRNVEMNVSEYPPVVSVYNSGSDSWKHIEDMDLVSSMCSSHRLMSSTFLNGVYYWLIDFKCVDVAILAFDMSYEKFQEIQVPDCIKSEKRGLHLSLYGDSIALLSCDHFVTTDKCLDIWVMKKEGCWIKSSTIGPFRDVRWPPLGFWKNKELLLESFTLALTLYNVPKQKLRTAETRGKNTTIWGYWIFSYKESLVSIKGEGGNCKLWDTSSDFVRDFFNYSSGNKVPRSLYIRV